MPTQGREWTSSTAARSLQTPGAHLFAANGAPEVTPLGEDRQMGLDSDEL